MRQLLLLMTFLVFSLSCSKKEDSTPTPVQQKVAYVAIKAALTSPIFWAGESDAITLSAELKDDKGVVMSNYSGKITYFSNGTALTGNSFNPTAEGSYEIKAQADNISSTNSLTITVKSPQKELEKIVMTSGFYQKYAVWYTMTGSKPELSVKGLG